MTVPSLLQRRYEVLAEQPMQVQQRQHLGHLRALTDYGGLAERNLALVDGLIDSPVIHPRCGYLQRPATVVTWRHRFPEIVLA
jgi:hypothetical protein